MTSSFDNSSYVTGIFITHDDEFKKYHIQTRLPKNVAEVLKSLSDFDKLRKQLAEQHQIVVSFPKPKSGLFSSTGDPAKKATDLQNEFNRLLKEKPAVFAETCMVTFLQLQDFYENLSRIHDVENRIDFDSKMPQSSIIGKKLAPADFQFGKLIGQGNFARVFQAKCKVDKQFYAVKVMEKSRILQKKEVRHVMAERAVLLHSLSNPFIVKLHGAFQTDNKLYFVMDLINGGELFHHLQKTNGHLGVPRAIFYATELVVALEFLHTRKIIYRDLKPENILLSGDGHVVLADMGLCKLEEKTKSFCGTPEYLAPEILLKKEYTSCVDWWAFGCVLYEMLYGLPPFYNKTHRVMYNDVLYSQLVFKPPERDRTVPKEAKDLLAKVGVREKNASI